MVFGYKNEILPGTSAYHDIVLVNGFEVRTIVHYVPFVTCYNDNALL